ncbi:cupin domain-containing protein [Cupriavidus sp. D39]|uniref:cupin domain-containing protein n=1 Tax=Cupriavidus sp. D39 TaxID=2997877 RepID=UPI002271FE59|nr:cupin domain-containing protein [Cupriavidus sp. D39]MCY0855770.1 cupin domain-containing protein [Cupriavidus sp. D39]
MNYRVEPKFIFTDSRAVPWQDSKLAKGVQVKNLGKANGRALQLVRFELGAVFPRHEHHGPEFIFLLEGDAIQNGHRLMPGWVAVAEQGTIDDSFRSESGCLFLFHYSI